MFYGAAEFSRTCDIVIVADSENLRKLEAALNELEADCIAVPPMEWHFLEKGHAIHFRCKHPDSLPRRLIDVNQKHIVEFEKINVFHLLCQLSQIGFKGTVDFAQACFELFLPRFISAGSDHQLVAIGTDFQRRLRRDLQHFQNWFVDHKRQAIAVFYEHFLHFYRLLIGCTQSVYHGLTRVQLKLAEIVHGAKIRTH